MEESRDPKSAVNVSKDAGQESGAASDRDAEATSGTTLSELEETQKSSEGKGGGGVGGASSSMPSPDGAFDEKGGGRADGSDSGGPM